MELTEDELFDEGIRKFGTMMQEEMIKEECAELIHALSKYHRALRTSKDPVIIAAAEEHVCEEIADVEVVLGKAHKLFDEIAIEQFRMIKLHRLAERMGHTLLVRHLCTFCIYNQEDMFSCSIVTDRKGYRRIDPITKKTYVCSECR